MILTNTAKPLLQSQIASGFHFNQAIRYAEQIAICAQRSPHLNSATAWPLASHQVPEHLLAGVNDPSSVIAGALFCYGVGNDLPDRAQNGTGPFLPIELGRL